MVYSDEQLEKVKCFCKVLSYYLPKQIVVCWNNLEDCSFRIHFPIGCSNDGSGQCQGYGWASGVQASPVKSLSSSDEFLRYTLTINYTYSCSLAMKNLNTRSVKFEI